MSTRLSNEQKIKQRPMRPYATRQWMLTNYGIALGIFETRKQADEYARNHGRDMQHHEIRRVQVAVESLP